jgi:hypothetical protein
MHLNKINYNLLSNIEINKLVSERLKIEYTSSFNPCEIPNDAWIAITFLFDNNVTLGINGGGVITSNFGIHHNGKSLDVESLPLRASMIVYLTYTEIL